MTPNKIQEIITFLNRANDLKAVPRFSASLKSGGDTVAEHSWRLALMTFIIAQECNLDINLEKALIFSLLHDLAEAKTGDIDGYLVATKKVSLKDKEVAEEKAMHEMTDDLSFGEWIYHIWEEYEKQEIIESKLVKALDKIEAYLHIMDTGVEAYIPKEFHADYADKAVAAFDAATSHFPELKDLLQAVKASLKEKLEARGVTWESKI
jgi:putative hydrolase of HD superfamily